MKRRAAHPSPCGGFPATSNSLSNSVTTEEGQTPKPKLRPRRSCRLGSTATSSIIPKCYGATEHSLAQRKNIPIATLRTLTAWLPRANADATRRHKTLRVARLEQARSPGSAHLLAAAALRFIPGQEGSVMLVQKLQMPPKEQ